MKRLLRLLVLFLPLLAAGDDFPQRSSTLVTDFAEIISPQEKAQLEAKLVAFNDSTSTQLAVVIMRSTGGYEIADYAVQLYNKWGIGQSNKNNGVLLLVALDDRKVFITTGYGMEGVLPDALCKRIIERDIKPRFKSGDYFGGIDAATSSIIGITKGEYTADDFTKKKQQKGILFPLIMFIIIVAIVMGAKAANTSRYARMNNLSFWAAWALLNAAASRNRGSWNSFSGGSGGFGGGGFGGGGFGGFGGGMSGGGGAGGSW
jgi:uncharacterized protein